VPHNRRAVTVGNDGPVTGLASQVSGGSVPATPVWPWHSWRVGTGSERSLESIGQADLIRLAELAAQAETRLFERNPDGAGRYAGRLLCRALCQGAARHYLDGTTGIKDFDVWSFYAEHDDGPFPYRWRGTADFGPSRFGRYPHGPPSFGDGASISSAGRFLPRSPTTRLPSFACTYLPPAPGQRKPWRPRQSCSSTRPVTSARSSGP